MAGEHLSASRVFSVLSADRYHTGGDVVLHGAGPLVARARHRHLDPRRPRHLGLVSLPAPSTSTEAEVPAAIVAVLDSFGSRARRWHRSPGVQANSALTATTGLVLVVMLAAEGLTIASIGPLVSWHIGIGLALVPPITLKLGSTLWRFAHYYLGDARYRRAGPPQPLLRAMGPLVALSTLAVMASGVALWLAGPPPVPLLDFVHKASFVIWFGLMAIHVLAHLRGAGKLAAADLGPYRRARVPHARSRQGLVLMSVVVGVALGIGTRGLVSGWSVWTHAAH